MNHACLFSAMTALILPLTLAHAEVREIPAEEMTETYIKDTTVIIQRRQPDNTRAEKKNIRIHELNAPYSEGEQTPPPAMDALPSTWHYRSEINNEELNATTTYEFSSRSVDPSQAQREANLRAVTGIPAETAINYDTLSFPTDITTSVPPIGISSEINPGQFEIIIPNTNHYSPQSHSTPNGEYQVDITPDDITFRINLPGQ